MAVYKTTTAARPGSTNQPVLKWRSRLSRPLANGIQTLIRRTSIRRKIVCGYALALSIAAVGTVTGQVLGNFYTQQALQRLDHEQDEGQLLSSLKIAVLKAQSQQQQLTIVIREPRLFEQKRFEFLARAYEIDFLLSKLRDLTEKSSRQSSSHELEINQFLRTHDRTLENYNQKLGMLLEKVGSLPLADKNLPGAQQALWRFTSSEAALKLTRFSEELARFVELSYREQNQAEAALERAEALRGWLTNVSLLLSVILAAALALQISRSISQPLETVTQIAQRVTKESNFDLQAPVMTRDEVGVLATSLNSLIQSVAGQTRELELARQHLEKRVADRTEELSHKNQQLQQAHDELNQALQDLQHAQTQLIHAEKMSSLGRMVASIAHEINNPVSFIYGNLNPASDYVQDLLKLVFLYQQQYPEPTAATRAQLEAMEFDFLVEDLPKLLTSMKLGAERLRQLVLSLRNFSRLDEAELKATNLHEGMDNILLFLNRRLHSAITVTKAYGNLPLIECYPAQLNQVFMNILDNAIDALLSVTDHGSKQIVISTEALHANAVRVRIWNSGPEIPAAIQSKLFDPFFTTKPVGQGTGLGLAICYQIIEKHQGKIELHSASDQGTEFVITLPTQHPQVSFQPGSRLQGSG